MRRYDLVAREYDNDGNYVKDSYIVIDGKKFNNIYDIDEYTSGRKLIDVWNDILKSNNIKGFSSAMIRMVDGHDIDYKDIIINNNVINSCVKDINDKGEVNVDNDLFKSEVKDFFRYLNEYDINILRDYLLDEDKELLLLVKEFIKTREDNLYKGIITKFSDYLNFRTWILNKSEIKRRGIYLNYLKDYYDDNEFVRKFNTEGGEFIYDDSKEEFLTEEELVSMKVKNKKL